MPDYTLLPESAHCENKYNVSACSPAVEYAELGTGRDEVVQD